MTTTAQPKTEKVTMTGAEFHCAREFLGLPPQWVAAKVGVHIKTVYQWEKPGKGNVPERARLFMATMLSAAERAVGNMTIKWEADEIPIPHGRDLTPNSQYPSSFHRAIASRVAERTGKRLVYKEDQP
jgi:DNA-binding transcriptional regulator YiaG